MIINSTLSYYNAQCDMLCVPHSSEHATDEVFKIKQTVYSDNSLNPAFKITVSQVY